jgi:hypothetical protein
VNESQKVPQPRLIHSGYGVSQNKGKDSKLKIVFTAGSQVYNWFLPHDESSKSIGWKM